MFDQKMQIFCGGARVVASLPEEHSDAIHGRCGIGAADWEVLRCKTFWTPRQVEVARVAIDKLLAHALTASGLPAIPLPAEYVAACIAVVIPAANWMAAAQAARAGLDGSMLVQSNGDATQQRELVSSERLFALILAYSGEVEGYIIGSPPAEPPLETPTSKATKK